MTSNKIVAISDLHLGQNGTDKLGQYSLLSTRVTGNLVSAFADAVDVFSAKKPYTLLVAGDFLDLSIAFAEEAFADLHELLVELPLPAELVYVIGNHDHHLWSLHSEDKRLLAPLRAGSLPSPKGMYQVTPRNGEGFAILQPFVDGICGRGRVKVTAAYPSYERQIGSTLLYVTHGHLFGGLYTELSDLLAPRLADLPPDRVAATVNHPIIELIYWQLGEAGEGLGADGLVEEIYTDIQKGKLSKVRPIVEALVMQVLPHGVLWRVIGDLRAKDRCRRPHGRACQRAFVPAGGGERLARSSRRPRVDARGPSGLATEDPIHPRTPRDRGRHDRALRTYPRARRLPDPGHGRALVQPRDLARRARARDAEHGVSWNRRSWESRLGGGDTMSACSNPTPPWFVGHWREWHRGHGCEQDDGKPRSDAAKTEVTQHAANASTGYLTDAELSFLRARTTSGDTLLVRALDELTARRSSQRDARQATVFQWCIAAFGSDQANITQRALRLLEESIEAYQAAEGDRAMGHELLNYVFDRPPGEIQQELGGVGIGVLALAAAAGCSADEAERREVDRVMSKPLSHFAARNQAKIDAGFLAKGRKDS